MRIINCDLEYFLIDFWEFIDSSAKPVVLGPLTMHPPADDNYGIDSCSIMCIQTTPPIVVIATCEGKIYHALLLKDEVDEDNKKVWFQLCVALESKIIRYSYR